MLIFLGSTGKKYVFDIERTKTEAYDRIRRMLYALEQVHCDKEQETPADEGLSNRLTCDNECQVRFSNLFLYILIIE